MELEDFRDKVFDKQSFNFALNLIECVEKQPTDIDFLKRAILNSFSFCKNLEEVSQHLASVKEVPYDSLGFDKKGFLDILYMFNAQDDLRDEFLMTLRHLNEAKSFNGWNELFLAIRSVGPGSIFEFLRSVRSLAAEEAFSAWLQLHKTPLIYPEQEILSDILLTVRLLSKEPHFSSWEEFYKTLFTYSVEPNITSEILITIRAYLRFESFQSWQDFFTCFKVLAAKNSKPEDNFFLALRHAPEYFHDAKSFSGFFRLMSQYPQYADAFAYGQLDSKKWLIEEAKKVWPAEWGRVFVLAGWIGLLPRFIFDAGINTISVRSFDIDESANKASEILNQTEVQKDWLFKSSQQDICKLQYPSHFQVQRKDGSNYELIESPDVVINTSCEHLADISSWWSQIPSGTRVILQSNDGFHIPEHVGCFKNLEDFKQAMKLSHLDFAGEKALPEFNRFMLIGRK